MVEEEDNQKSKDMDKENKAPITAVTEKKEPAPTEPIELPG